MPVTSSRRQISAAPEIFFGLVGALGSDLDRLTETLTALLQEHGYASHLVRVSDLLREIPAWRQLPLEPLDRRIEAHQTAGNRLRETTKVGGALAILGMGEIRKHRERNGGDPFAPLPRQAYIVRSLKHVGEVDVLRRTYGASFFLVAAYSPAESRRRRLAQAIAESRQSSRDTDFTDRAQALIQRDDAETQRRMGQQVRDVFPRADVFVDVERFDDLPAQLARFVDLVFGHPFHTPSRDEFAMFHAEAAALRSSDLSRQVGAVIATSDGDVIAVGSNEVPKFGGGLYWPGDPGDARDFQVGRSESLALRRTMLGELLSMLETGGWLAAGKSRQVRGSTAAAVAELTAMMKNTLLMDVGEFGRTVHAEMAALVDAARRGVEVRGQTLYTTTFPCHNCTKHIVAAGIGRVVYRAPFPKSKAERLHADTIVVDSSGPVVDKVNFHPFVGIAPRRYMDLFTMGERQVAGGGVVRPTKLNASPRWPTPGTLLTYPEEEQAALIMLRQRLAAAGLRTRSRRGKRNSATRKRGRP